MSLIEHYYADIILIKKKKQIGAFSLVVSDFWTALHLLDCKQKILDITDCQCCQGRGFPTQLAYFENAALEKIFWASFFLMYHGCKMFFCRQRTMKIAVFIMYYVLPSLFLSVLILGVSGNPRTASIRRNYGGHV